MSNPTLELLLNKFEQKFIIPKNYWPKQSEFYKYYRKDIWGEYQDGEALKLFITHAYEEGRKEAVEEIIKILKVDSQESIYTNIPPNAKMAFHEYLDDRFHKLASLLGFKEKK